MTLGDCQEVVRLEKLVWGFTDDEDLLPASVLIASIKRGGILLGAFDGTGHLAGFVYSVPGLKEGRPMQWSHMLGVTPDARNAGLGLQLKVAQRRATLEMGLDLIEWTYDPLQTLNAHLNFARLGVVVNEYEVNIYGESSSPLHRGTPTDRFVAEWHISEAHVERRIATSGPVVRDRSVLDARVVNPAVDGADWVRPTPGNLTFADRRLLVEIPTGFARMQQQDPALALEWRLTTRAIFLHYFCRGYCVVDFFLSREARRGQYLLSTADT